MAGRPADYPKFGIDPVEVAQFEDGQRIGTEKGRYEWWYFDAHLDDGATVVVVFYTKPNVSPNGPLAPRITINLTLPDGRQFEKFYDTAAEQFTASEEGCDVRIGTNRFVGDLRRYRITAAIEELSVEIELTSEVRAWRPKSGHLYFGAEGRENLFAWLPSVPQGVAHVRYKIGHEEHRACGNGYHDHNWGDVPMQTLMHNWYGARAKAGPYTVIVLRQHVDDLRLITKSLRRRNVGGASAICRYGRRVELTFLKQVADVYETSGRYQVLHQSAQRVQTVTANVSGRDLASFVADGSIALLDDTLE